ncbi:MAG TPA: single-stranded-DNA-specific exonuclease RecJ [Anaerolineales bacterium]
MTRWTDAPRRSAARLANLGLSELLQTLLVSRGIEDEAAARAFLNPESVAPVPFPGVEPMVERLLKAVDTHEQVLVWGDFDLDGQTSTALLVQSLRMVGANVRFHAPVRATEGHGIHLPTLQHFLGEGITLVLTCDTGITANQAVESANTHGAEFLVTDHHDPADILPAAFALINPKLLPAGHPLGNLAGVGVAYKLAEAFLNARGGDPTTLLDLVALGLIADVATLQGETRALAHRGIRSLRRTGRLGLRVLAELSQTDLESLTEETIGFVLAPRLNSVGRLADANDAVEFLLTADEVRARVLAGQIESLNAQRRLLTQQLEQAAESQLMSDPAVLSRPLLLLRHASWPAGVLGIVASRLVERYGKPVILLSRGEDGVWRGSARSIDGIHITEAIADCKDILLSYGGHPMAAGLSIRDEDLARFSSQIQRKIEGMLSDAHVQEGTLRIDEWVPLCDLTLELAQEIDRLAPFGAGNAAPVLATSDLSILQTQALGQSQEHRRLTVSDQTGMGAEIRWWGGGQDVVPSGPVDVAYTIRPTMYRGERKLSLTLVGIRPSKRNPLQVTPAPPELQDLRRVHEPLIPSGCLVWEEGFEKNQGVDRFHLSPSQDFAIWTAPPGPHELSAALKVVMPRVVYLVGRRPDAPVVAHEFLKQLGGMVKFAMREREGYAVVSELASACAARELSIRLGLEWFVASGHIRTQADGDRVKIAAGTGLVQAPLRDEFMTALRSLLDETAAYRAYVRDASPLALAREWMRSSPGG